MVRIRKDLTITPDDVTAIVVHHDGPAGPGPDRAHFLQCVPLADVPGTQDALVYYADPALALRAATRFCAKPLIIQDLCITCAGYYYRPRWPRENIYRLPNPVMPVPCLLFDWV